METWKHEIQGVLENNILNFWMDKMADCGNGGYYGRIDGRGLLYPEAERGAVLNARILWAFSAAYRVLRKPEYLAEATRAKDYFVRHFIDTGYGGVYWSVDAQGLPLNTRKQTYAIGFALYGLSEYVRATGDREALATAVSLYETLETHAFDAVSGGYIEALARDWTPLADMRLSDKDENASRTLNTHLHILEPYTNLYRVWKDPALERSILRLLRLFLSRFLNPESHHLDLFFDDRWQGRRNVESFGHDIEASWLIHEAALVLGDKELLLRVEPGVRKIARAADEGLREDGSMIYEHWKDTGKYDLQRQWWVQCETVIGHINLYQYFGDEEALEVARRCWKFIRTRLIDWEEGEWYWGVKADGTVDLNNDRAGFWKCPYHNTRMCLELIQRHF